jgi:hypothetical protein
MWDNFHATPPLFVSSADLKTNSIDNNRFMDMNPISSRTNIVDYRRQISYIPDNIIKTNPSGLTEISRSNTISYELPPTLPSSNPYLSRLDPAGDDSRNIIRELKSAVVEDNRDRMLDSSRLMIERQFSSSRYLPKKIVDSASEMMAYELLRPKVSSSD